MRKLGAAVTLGLVLVGAPHAFQAGAGDPGIPWTAGGGGGDSGEGDPGPVQLEANFELVEEPGVPPFRARFRQLSTGCPTSYEWDFGDGGSSTEREPEHLFMTGDLATVRLTVRSRFGEDTIEKTIEPRMLPPGFQDELIMATPTQTLGFLLHGDHIYYWLKRGVFLRWVDGISVPVLNISEEVGNWSNHGLTSVALDPHYDQNGYIYCFYAVDRHHLDHFGTPSYDPGEDDFFRGTIGRLTRYTVPNPTDPSSVADPGSRLVLLGEDETSGIPLCAPSHGLCSLVFGRDGSLIMAAGDSHQSNTQQQDCIDAGFLSPAQNVDAYRAQYLDSPNGKVLRLNPASGDGHNGNPFFDPLFPRSWRSRVYALGLRNPWQIVVSPEDLDGDAHPARLRHDEPGAILIGDVGNQSWEELSVLTEGGQNFGWPTYEGMERNAFFAGQNRANLSAPNPLFGQFIPGQGTCNQEFFIFQDLLLQDSLLTPFWPNPCDPSVEVPASLERFVHRRPALTWIHQDQVDAPLAYLPGYDQSGGALSLRVQDELPAEPFWGDAAIGGAFYTGQRYPEEFRDVYFHTDYAQHWVQAVRFDGDWEVISVEPFLHLEDVNIVSLKADDEALWYLRYLGTGQRGIHRISYNENAAPVAVADVSPTFGPAPLRVVFDGRESFDPEVADLEYAWDLGPTLAGTPLLAEPRLVHWFPAEDVTDSGTLITPGGLDEGVKQLVSGGGPATLGALSDGVFPDEGDPVVDTVLSAKAGWVAGYAYSEARDFFGLTLQEGQREATFTALHVEVRDLAGVWQPVTGLEVNPPYPGDPELARESFHLVFDPLAGTAIRLVGRGARRGSIALSELRAHAVPLAGQPAPERYDVDLTVTDAFGEGHTDGDFFVINATPPTAVITSPPDRFEYPVGVISMLDLTSVVDDAEDDPGSLSCAWAVDLVHEDHTHPEPVDFACTSSFPLVPHDELQGDRIFWSVQLTVTDPWGLSTTVQHSVVPEGDCNLNGVLDADDITQGTSQDMDANGIPDECQPVLVFGCGVNPPDSMQVQGRPAPGATLVFSLDDPGSSDAAPSLSLVKLSTRVWPNFPCGVSMPTLGNPAGELLIQLGASISPLPLVSGTLWTPRGLPAEVTLTLPNIPEFLGQTYYAQGILFAPGRPDGEEIVLTDAVRLQF